MVPYERNVKKLDIYNMYDIANVSENLSSCDYNSKMGISLVNFMLEYSTIFL